MPTARSQFDLDVWEEADEPYRVTEGAKLLHGKSSRLFAGGDIDGRGHTEMIMAQTTEEKSATYVGIEYFEGTVHGKKGSFVLSHSSSQDRGELSSRYFVVPGSATGELKGMRGTATITITPEKEHFFELEYELPA
ncbi:DUF3224 domain-containing protein [Actinokineospora iranica]|uniref:DUF3224 domain-containing protein n=1 Tax=Actinokineospora iranica TaxID=1271860 RepID=A0A1G6W6H1_9PSEU|nr:DUF3224 domain-containing protein [Actinokineospora iranica]SDD61540.1 Protein of unknown function [Actinokineospora iranica]